jgi:hypothetical protein
MKTPAEHAKIIRSTLRKVESATRAHHKALQEALEDHGTACGLTEGEVTTLGGGTPKHV